MLITFSLFSFLSLRCLIQIGDLAQTEAMRIQIQCSVEKGDKREARAGHLIGGPGVEVVQVAAEEASEVEKGCRRRERETDNDKDIDEAGTKVNRSVR